MILNTSEELDSYLEDLQAQGYTLHHESWGMGYVSRQIAASAEPYKGQFGKGYVLHIPCSTSTRYHIKQYYTRKES